MNIHSNEELLTAYALGELDEAEIVKAEALIANDESARQMLLEIRAAVALSEEALGAESDAALEGEQRVAIKRAALAGESTSNSRRSRFVAYRRMAMAASFLLVASGAGWFILSEVTSRPVREAALRGSGADSVEAYVTAKNNETQAPAMVMESSSRRDEASKDDDKVVGSRPFASIFGSGGGPVKPEAKAEVSAEFLSGFRFEPESETPTQGGQVVDQLGALGYVDDSGRITDGVRQLNIRVGGELRLTPGNASDPNPRRPGDANGQPLPQISAGAIAVVNAPQGAQLTQEEKEELRALGYIDVGTAGNPLVAANAPEKKPFPHAERDVSQSLIVSATANSITGAPHSERGGKAKPNSDAQQRAQKFRVARAPEWRYRPVPAKPPQTPGTEMYQAFEDNGFVLVGNEPLSTFSIDVDTASYANMRRFIKQGQLPPPDSVRVEELINYFSYDYAGPDSEAPFAAHMAVASAPWQPAHRLVRIGLKGAEMNRDERPAANLVFLLDVSGSMQRENKLPLVKRAISVLTEQLNGNDRVAIVTYAGSSGLALPSTRGDEYAKILRAVDELQAGGSTNGAAGIALAYQIATQNFIQDGINRVIFATDGDFNVGVTSRGDLERMIEDKAKSGVFLTVAGFGMGNLKDATLETLSNKGNGNYAYIDTFKEARKVFVEDLMGTLVTIAKDVKIQVEFNPTQVSAYRLIGYENRALAAQDFNDDKKDAGEIGAGHTVTALYEVVPVGTRLPGSSVDPLRYQSSSQTETVDERFIRQFKDKVQAYVDSGHYIEAVSELELLRFDLPRHFDWATQRMIEIKQMGGLPLTVSEKEIVARAAKSSVMASAVQNELLTLKVRYKEPDENTSKLLTFHLTDSEEDISSADPDFKFAAAVASFGMMLRQSPHVADMSSEQVLKLAEDGALGGDPHGYRDEFIGLLVTLRYNQQVSLLSPGHSLEALDIAQVGPGQVGAGTFRVRIKWKGSIKWYDEGDAFGTYRLLSINPVKNSCTVYLEDSSTTVELVLPRN